MEELKYFGKIAYWLLPEYFSEPSQLNIESFKNLGRLDKCKIFIRIISGEIVQLKEKNVKFPQKLRNQLILLSLRDLFTGNQSPSNFLQYLPNFYLMSS